MIHKVALCSIVFPVACFYYLIVYKDRPVGLPSRVADSNHLTDLFTHVRSNDNVTYLLATTRSLKANMSAVIAGPARRSPERPLIHSPGHGLTSNRASPTSAGSSLFAHRPHLLGRYVVLGSLLLLLTWWGAVLSSRQGGDRSLLPDAMAAATASRRAVELGTSKLLDPGAAAGATGVRSGVAAVAQGTLGRRNGGEEGPQGPEKDGPSGGAVLPSGGRDGLEGTQAADAARDGRGDGGSKSPGGRADGGVAGGPDGSRASRVSVTSSGNGDGSSGSQGVSSSGDGKPAAGKLQGAGGGAEAGPQAPVKQLGGTGDGSAGPAKGPAAGEAEEQGGGGRSGGAVAPASNVFAATNAGGTDKASSSSPPSGGPNTDSVQSPAAAAATSVKGSAHGRGVTPEGAADAPASPVACGEGGERGALARARAALARHRGPGIPRIIHQVYGLYDDAGPAAASASGAAAAPPLSPAPLPQAVRQSVLSWQQRNPGHTHVLWGPRDVEALVEGMFPAFAPAYRSFSLPVLRADLARYLIVFAFGGTYSDTDTTCLKPIDSWADGRPLDSYGAIVGIEADAGSIPGWERHWGRALQICQWTFAAEPAHPLLAHVVFRISQLLEKRPPDSLAVNDVTHVTGPTVMSDATNDYLAAQGHNVSELAGLRRGVLLGDLVVLPITAFSPGVGHMGAGDASDPEARVQHGFRGSWLKQGRPKMR